MTTSRPDLSFLIPPNSENRWTDLLAALISTDPRPIGTFIGGEPDEVRREVAVGGADRLDLLLLRDGRQLAAIEVKLLSDLGARQLDRYRATFADAALHLVLHLGLLPVNHRSAPGWKSLTWEKVLAAYTASDHPWVAATAQAWLALLPELAPQVGADSVWNHVPDDPACFELNLRAKVAWLATRMDDWCEDLDHELTMSTGGGSWVVIMRAPIAGSNHRVVAEVQEGMPAQAWRPDPSRRYRDRLAGPVALIGLSQTGIATSAGFDWQLLHRLFRGRIVDDQGQIIDGRSWQTTPANPKHSTDRANWLSVVAAGAPRWLGKGYGMTSAVKYGSCVFGARLQFPPTIALGELDAEFHRLQPLVEDMAAAANAASSVDPNDL